MTPHDTADDGTDAEPKRPVWLIGRPVSHSLSARFQNAGFEALGLPLRYIARDTHIDELPALIAAIREGGAAGANVTLPYKEAVLPLVDRLSPTAQRTGAVNTIVRVGPHVEGHNTDVSGLSRALCEHGLRRRAPERALILGAGGAARAAVITLDQLGARHIFIANRTRARAEALIEGLAAHTRATLSALSLDEDAGHIPWGALDVLLHSTSLGVGSHQGDATYEAAARRWGRLPWGAMEGLRVVYDLVYARGEPTPFLRAAQEGRRPGHDGLDMLLYQGTEAFTLWTGRQAPEEIMRRACV